MRAELIKVRTLPTPTWCLIFIFACFLLGLGITFARGPGEDAAAIDAAIGLPTFICSIVFGVWIVGVEYGQTALRRTLTSDPRRIRLIGVKIATVVLLTVLLTVVLHLVAFPLYDLAAGRHDVSLDAGVVTDYCIAAVITNVAYALVGIAFALITASMAGGITATLVFVFVIDTVVALVPWTEDYAMGTALTAITEDIRGTDGGLFGDVTHGADTGDVLLVAGWIAGLLLLGALRFRRSDVK